MMNQELFNKLNELFGVTATQGEMDEVLLLLGVSGSACSKCGMLYIDMKFQPVETKIYWNEHYEIDDIKNFTRNDRYYSCDRIKKECLVHTCKTCGYKKAVAVADR